jgi:hypothetical protein
MCGWRRSCRACGLMRRRTCSRMRPNLRMGEQLVIGRYRRRLKEEDRLCSQLISSKAFGCHSGSLQRTLTESWMNWFVDVAR